MTNKYKHKYFTKISDDTWILNQDIEVNVGPFSGSVLKAGHTTNFASIPSWPEKWKRMPLLGAIFKLLDPRRIIDPDDDAMAIPSAFHDAWVGEFSEYATIKVWSPEPGAPAIEYYPDWNKAANEFKKLMFGFRASPWKRFIVYWAVRVYGIYRSIEWRH